MTPTHKGTAPKSGDDLREIWRVRLAERGLKWSRQRDLIAEAFFAAGGHVSVEELLKAAKKRDAKVSQATVYRTVKLLAECGLALEQQFGDRQARYETGGSSRQHHDHLICNDCGRIIEFAEPRIEALQEAVAERHGFAVTAHRLELYGLCSKCRKR
jgi:Fur family transcriptional regulator, ferric uptake regulator